MDSEQLTRTHPVLFHMAEDGAWPSIQKNGLLSTRALVDLYAPDDTETRAKTLGDVRRSSVRLDHTTHGSAVVRDQGPLKYIDRCLTKGTTTQQYLDALNGRVFFWLSEARLRKLLNARRYRGTPQTVLRLDTAALLARHGATAQLAPYNTGSMHVPNSPVRGLDVFQDVAAYPYDDWRTKRGRRGEPVVELTVRDAVPDARAFVTAVERWDAGQRVETLYRA